MFCQAILLLVLSSTYTVVAQNSACPNFYTLCSNKVCPLLPVGDISINGTADDGIECMTQECLWGGTEFCPTTDEDSILDGFSDPNLVYTNFSPTCGIGKGGKNCYRRDSFRTLGRAGAVMGCGIPECFYNGQVPYNTVKDPAKMEELLVGCTQDCLDDHIGNGICDSDPSSGGDTSCDCPLERLVDCIPEVCNVNQPKDSTSNKPVFAECSLNAATATMSTADICTMAVEGWTKGSGDSIPPLTGSCYDICLPWNIQYNADSHRAQSLRLDECPSILKGGKATRGGDDSGVYCAPACPPSYLGNGNCDIECQTVQCHYDYLDCPEKICSPAEPLGKDTVLDVYLPIGYLLDYDPYSVGLCTDTVNNFFYYSLGGYLGNCVDFYYDWYGTNVVIILNNDKLEFYFTLLPALSLYNPTTCTILPTALSSEYSHVTSPTVDPLNCQSLDLSSANAYLFGFYPSSLPFYVVTYSATASSGVSPCSWGQVGDGICQAGCQVSECLGDLGDCSIRDNECEVPDYCDISWLGDGYCDFNDGCFFSEACNYDGGDCWCARDCPWPLLVNGVCDSSCDVPECNHDFGDCDCAPGCNRWMLNNTDCDPECDNVECSYDAGVCLLAQNETAPVTDKDYSVFTVTIYKYNETSDDGNNCPDLEEIPNLADHYDADFHQPKDQPPKKTYNKNLVELLSTYQQFFGHCYTSYSFGGYYATRSNLTPHEGDSAILFYGCNSDCTNCSSIPELTFNNGECQRVTSEGSDLLFKMKWTNSGSSLTFFIGTFVLVILARYL